MESIDAKPAANNTTATVATPASRKEMTAALVRSELLSERTKHLEFEIEGIDRFDFVPGQFVSIKEPRLGGKTITRAYSIASAPNGMPRFALCVNRVDEGFMSNYLCDLPLEAKVHLYGPHGSLVLPPEPTDSLLIATGTGIAPFRSIVEWLFDVAATTADLSASSIRHHGRQVWLVYGTRYEEDIFYKQEFEAIANRHPNFHYRVILSRAPKGWTGEVGHVQEPVRRIASIYAEAGRQDLTAYICGLGDMVIETRKLLKEQLGWEHRRIVVERYS